MSHKQSCCLSTKFRRIARVASTNLPNGFPPVLYCTDEDRNTDNVRIIANLHRGWGVIYRARNLELCIEEAKELSLLCKSRGVRFLLSQYPAIAREIGADGVHWPEARIKEARYWRGYFPFVTASTHSYAGMRNSLKFPVDAVLYSSVFKSESWSSRSPIGATKYRKIVRASSVTVYALAGVTVENGHLVASVGGVASVSGLANALGS